MQKFTPFIWFQGNAEEAMNYYVATFKNSKITHIERYAGDQGIPGEKELKGKVLTGVFELDGQQFMCLDGGPVFEMTGAISFQVEYDTQAELDEVWEKLIDGGKPLQCGWVTDKFGVTWQITPAALGKMMSDPAATPRQKKALMQAMMPMVKLDIAKLEAAFEGAKQ
ncbi:MAG TPA: VOC family protein [Candidatus Saccharimonadales bacterium]|nr:VOC family protein [Candidatus Saccharimonadales bacterium]